MISVIIPVSYEDYENRVEVPLVDTILLHAKPPIEVILQINSSDVGRVNAKNHGAEKAQGDILVFIDADCTIEPGFLEEVEEKAKNPYFIGGGVKHVKPTSWSLGFLAAYFRIGIHLILHQITIGAFWIRKDAFVEMGGFHNVVLDDIDFATRLKALAKAKGKKFESIKRNILTWSTRKFDKYGSWHWLWGYERGTDGLSTRS